VQNCRNLINFAVVSAATEEFSVPAALRCLINESIKHATNQQRKWKKIKPFSSTKSVKGVYQYISFLIEFVAVTIT